MYTEKEMEELMQRYVNLVKTTFETYGKEAMLKTINNDVIVDATYIIFEDVCLSDLDFDTERAETLSYQIRDNFDRVFGEEIPNIYENHKEEMYDAIWKMTDEIKDKMVEQINTRDENAEL